MQTIGERIKSLREQRGFSQRELGQKVGLMQQHISFIESNDRRVHLQLARKLADALGVTVNDLAYEEVTAAHSAIPTL